MRISVAFATAIVSVGLASGGTIYSVTGTADTGFFVGGGSDQMLLASWTETGSYSNVSISAVLGNGTGAPINVYLTNQIGPGTTVANEIASTTITPAASPETDTLFTGLSLGNGTYYLVMASTSLSSVGQWYGTNSPSTTTDTGVTGNPDAFVSTSNGSPNAAFPPASNFPGGGTNLLFTVTGDAGVSTTPEPSSFILVGMAGAFLFCAKSRLRR